MLKGFGDVLTLPYLQNLRQDGITIMWELLAKQDCHVEYGSDTSYGNTAIATLVDVTDTDTDVYIYKVVLSGLSAGSKYHYRMVKGCEALDDQTFKTAPSDNVNFSFGVWGDSQGTNHESYPENPNEPTPTNAMMKHMASCVDFGVGVGDFSEDGFLIESVRANFLNRVSKHLGQKKPYFIAWGNHDRGRSSIIRKYADLPSKDRGVPYNAGCGNYSFDYAGCHFVCIDDDPSNEENPEREDWDWIEKDLKAAKANNPRFIFLFIHRAPYYERWYEGEVPMREYLVPLLEKYEVDVCFSGHTHAYGRGYKNGVYYCVTGGGSWLDKTEPLVRKWDHMTVGGFTDLADGIDGGLVNEYVKVDIDENGFTATMIPFNPDGSLMPNVTDVFSKEKSLIDINKNGQSTQTTLK